MKKFPVVIAALLAVTTYAVFARTPKLGRTCTVERGLPAEVDRWNMVVAWNCDTPVVHLIFSADSMFEGAPYALRVMDSLGVRGSFFFTGNFLRDTVNAPVIRRIVAGGHYVGTHSNRHLLLADWDRDRTPLVTADSMLRDLDSNYVELARFGVRREDTPWLLPPYEWAGDVHVAAYRKAGFTPVAPTTGIETYRDYTTPDDKYYMTADSMFNQLFAYERTHPLNGAMLLIHLGTQPVRTDKLYHRLPDIIAGLRARGYQFAPLRP